MLIVLMCIGFGLAHGQDSVWTKPKHVVTGLEAHPKLHRLVRKKIRRADNLVEFQTARAELASLQAAKGYAEFSIDTFARKGDTLVLTTHIGPRYLCDSIRLHGLNEVLYNKAGFPRAMRRPLDWTGLRGRLLYCLDEYQNQGYPFAAFDSLDLAYRPAGDTVYASIDYNFHPGKLVTLDTVIVEGEIRERDEFVRSLTGLYPGDIYNQEQIDNARRILNGSIYFKNTRVPKVEFISEDKARVTLHMDSRKSGKFDLLLGILPPRDETAKLEFTGLVDVQLVSPIFRAGEAIQFRFDKLVGASQKLHLQYAHPYLFGSPIRIQGEFDLLKQDTTFLTRYGKFSAAYAFTPNLALRVSYKGKTSSLISTDRWEQDSLNRPPVLDGKDQTYGVGFEFDNLDYRFNPRRGWRIVADVGLGRKKIVRNPRLHEQLYEGLELSIPKREADFHAEWYRSYSKRLVLKLANHTYWLDQAQYFQNDLLQVGGSRSIRGFDENQFFTNFLCFFTLENRFILEENSYLFVFTDYAYLENATAEEKVLRPWGLGLGLTYETKAGMLSVTYAVGKVGDFDFQPSRGRIHIGLINQF